MFLFTLKLCTPQFFWSILRFLRLLFKDFHRRVQAVSAVPKPLFVPGIIPLWKVPAIVPTIHCGPTVPPFPLN